MSKIEQARALLEQFPTRYLFVEAAMEQLGLTAAGAQTYFQNLKNEQLGMYAARGHYPKVSGLTEEEAAARARYNKANRLSGYVPYVPGSPPSGMFGLSPAVGLALSAAIF